MLLETLNFAEDVEADGFEDLFHTGQASKSIVGEAN
jgi:hypothetical protein